MNFNVFQSIYLVILLLESVKHNLLVFVLGLLDNLCNYPIPALLIWKQVYRLDSDSNQHKYIHVVLISECVHNTQQYIKLHISYCRFKNKINVNKRNIKFDILIKSSLLEFVFFLFHLR